MGLTKEQMVRADRVRVGDFYGAEGDTRVIAVDRYSGDGVMFRIVCDDGYAITCAPDSLLPVRPV